MNASCTECGGAMAVPDDAIVGEIVSCKDCSAEFEVSEIAGGNVILKAAEQAGEDWGE